MARVWLLAVCLSALAMWSILAACGERCRDDRAHPPVQLEGATGALIGSSLMESAVPDTLVIAETDQTLKRFALTNASAATQLSIAESALNQGADLIILELRPFVRVLRRRPWLERFGPNLRKAFKALVSGPEQAASDWPTIKMPPPRPITRRDLALVYPPEIIETPDSAALRHFLSRAADRSASVVFVVMPMSDSAATYSGDDYRAALEQRIAAFKAEFGVDIWQPAFAWSDLHFRDRSHMNATGRARFSDALIRQMDREP